MNYRSVPLREGEKKIDWILNDFSFLDAGKKEESKLFVKTWQRQLSSPHIASNFFLPFFQMILFFILFFVIAFDFPIKLNFHSDMGSTPHFTFNSPIMCTRHAAFHRQISLNWKGRYNQKSQPHWIRSVLIAQQLSTKNWHE